MKLGGFDPYVIKYFLKVVARLVISKSKHIDHINGQHLLPISNVNCILFTLGTELIRCDDCEYGICGS
jgi:hypothetical protein